MAMPVKSMSGLEKAAVLLKSLPAEVMDKVLRRMNSQHAGVIRTELQKLKQDSQLSSKLTAVLEEAATILDAAKKKPERVGQVAAAPAPPAPTETAAKSSRVDIRLAEKPDDKPAPSEPAAETEPLRALASLPPELLSAALEMESARTISLLINWLDITVAAEIYKRLSSAKRKEVSMRFTEPPLANEELLKRIAQGVLRKCHALRDSPSQATGEQGGREKRVAALLRGLERTERTEMLTLLAQADAELVGRVKAMLYQFEDIQLMENASVQKLLSEVDVKSLSLALRGAPPDIESKILANLSKRAQGALREETELTGSVNAAKVKQGRETIVEAIQRLDERGDLVLIEA
jgi:flagellar motor switch protein FliG